MSTQVIGAILPYFGGKRTMAPQIVEEFGRHTAFWDVFCGSMAVLMAKPPCRTEVVNDLHGDVINLARVIQHPTCGPALYRRLRRVWSSEDLFRDSLAVVRSAEPTPEDLDVGSAFHFFVASWQGMNGVAGTSAFNTNYCRRFTNKGGDAGARWVGAVRSIAAWRRRMERVQILNADAFDLIPRIADEDGTVVYVDPPYLKKGAKYKHDFRCELPGDPDPLVRRFGDHARLALALRRFKSARCVVSYYDDPALSDLYPGWRIRRIDVAKGLVNAGRRDEGGRVDAPEVLLVNGPLAVAPRSSLFD